jgi:hypothetical protein
VKLVLKSPQTVNLEWIRAIINFNAPRIRVPADVSFPFSPLELCSSFELYLLLCNEIYVLFSVSSGAFLETSDEEIYEVWVWGGEVLSTVATTYLFTSPSGTTTVQ